MEIQLILDPSGLPFRAGPPHPSQPRRASAYSLAPDDERHTVQGGGATLVELKTGDRITITNTEGGQRCELLAAHADGRVVSTLEGGYDLNALAAATKAHVQELIRAAT